MTGQLRRKCDRRTIPACELCEVGMGDHTLPVADTMGDMSITLRFACSACFAAVWTPDFRIAVITVIQGRTVTCPAITLGNFDQFRAIARGI